MMPMGRYHLPEQQKKPGTCDPGRRLFAASGGQLTEDIRRMKMELFQLPNIYLWKGCNACDDLPQMSLRGKYNVLTYHGNPNFVFYSVEGGRHNPDYNMADYVWRYFFSGYRRIDGEIVRVSPEKVFDPQESYVALAAGTAQAYVDNRLIKMRVPARVFNGTLCVAAKDVATLYPSVQVSFLENGESAIFTNGADYADILAHYYPGTELRE